MKAVLTAIALAMMLLSACTGGAVRTPSPTFAPVTFVCTPEAGGTPGPCTEAEFQRMQELDALYAEAEELYRRFIAERLRLYRTGSPASPELLGMVAGEALEVTKEGHVPGRQLQGGEYQIAWVRRLPGLSKAGSLVAMEACTDLSSVTRVVDGKPQGPGRIALEQIYFDRIDGSLKIVLQEYEVVEQC